MTNLGASVSLEGSKALLQHHDGLATSLDHVNKTGSVRFDELGHLGGLLLGVLHLQARLSGPFLKA
jgi:hypothetical protein